MIKGMIFDLDGVIVDTARYHYAAWKKLADLLGITFTEEENENLKGVSRMESLEYILNLGNSKFSDIDKKKLAATKNTWYQEMISGMDKSEILPGALDFVENAKKNGYKIALGSASKNAQTILRSVGMLDLFEVIIDGTKTTKSKPDPQVFLLGAEGLGLRPEECIVFEDSLMGIKAANIGGFTSIGIGDDKVLTGAKKTYPNLKSVSLEEIKTF